MQYWLSGVSCIVCCSIFLENILLTIIRVNEVEDGCSLICMSCSRIVECAAPSHLIATPPPILPLLDCMRQHPPSTSFASKMVVVMFDKILEQLKHMMCLNLKRKYYTLDNRLQEPEDGNIPSLICGRKTGDHWPRYLQIIL